jgi:uncharacterized protein (TIGR02145 family)
MKRLFVISLFLGMFLHLPGQGKFTDLRDGNVYRARNINNINWMTENLRYKAKEGTAYFDKDDKNNSAYGVLYDWKTAMKVCPDGWRLPTGAEFQALVNYFEQRGEWKNTTADTTSFGIQLAGMQDYEGTFTEMGESAFCWTSTEYDKDNAEYFSYMVVVNTPVIDVSRKDDIADIHGTEKSSKYSVRCVKK